MARPTALVIHDDGEALDALTRLFEAAGFEVTTALTGFRAQAHLEGERPIDVVVVPWDAAHPVGGAAQAPTICSSAAVLSCAAQLSL